MHIAFILRGGLRDEAGLLDSLRGVERSLPGASVTCLVSEYAGHAVELARTWATQADYLVAVGGDGTLHQVLNGLMQAGASAPERAPVLGLLAHGTANDFIKTAPLRGDLAELVDLLASRRHRAIDLGRIRFQGEQGEQQAYFVNMADIGIGAAVVCQLERQGKRLGATLSYLRAILTTFPRYRRNTLRVELDGALWHDGPVLALLVGNGRCFGSGLYAVPNALLDDGLFSITCIGDVTLWDFLRKLPQLRRGAQVDHPEVSYRSARRVRVESAQAVELEAEGESLGTLPCEMVILPAALEFLMPVS